MNITDFYVSDEFLDFAKTLNENNVLVKDKNWYGGEWPLKLFIDAETKIKSFARRYVDYSPLEKFALAYSFVAKREYTKPPKNSPFQTARGYVDVLTSSAIVCVGYATLLKRICDEFGIDCFVQGCVAIDETGKQVKHANNLVCIKDEKYDVYMLAYSDARMDSRNFVNNGVPCFNNFLIPLDFVDGLKINCFDSPTRIMVNDYQDLYYSNGKQKHQTNFLIEKLKITQNELSKLKNAKAFDDEKLEALLFNLQNVLGVSKEKILKQFEMRKNIFFANAKNITEAQKNIVDFAKSLLKTKIEYNKDVGTFDCASFVRYVFMHEICVDVLKNGYGKSTTTKIMSGDVGKNILVDENLPLSAKKNFLQKNAEIGDVMFFHSQSLAESSPSKDNFYPGHVGIYVGNGKYIDARWKRGNVELVDIDKDDYIAKFVGIKKVLENVFENKISYKNDAKLQE